MIEGFIGRPGSGKTLWMTKRCIAAAKRGQQVFSNYPIDYPGVYLFEPDDLLHLPEGVVAIDEAHLWFPARGSLQLPMSWLAGMSQTRKMGWHLLWSAQHENRVDRVIRDVTNWMHLCSAWFGGGDKPPLLFTIKTWEPETFRAPKKSMGGAMMRFPKEAAARYQTFGKVTQAKHTRRAADPYAERQAARAAAVKKGNEND